MKHQDQDIENRLKCLNGPELTELLDFILPNRSGPTPVAEEASDLSLPDTLRPN